MKSLIILSFLIAVLVSARAQYGNRQVPGPVSQSFQRQYPDAHDPQWHQQHHQWHARFNDRGPEDRGEMEAHYDPYGRPIDSHIRYDERDVPPPVMRWPHHRYHHGGGYQFTRIERPQGEPLFQVSVNFGGRSHVSYVDEQGRGRDYNDRH